MTDLDEVRANMIDEAEPYTFSDPKIQDLLDKYGDVNYVSFLLWMARAGSAAIRSFKFSTDKNSVDKTMTAKECREQAAVFKELAVAVPGDGVAEIEWTEAFDPPEGTLEV